VSAQDGFIVAQALGKNYASRSSTRPVRVFEHISFSQREGAFVSMVGASGCGKTTLLKIVGGLTAPSSGTVYVNGRLVIEPPAEAVIVFQDYSKSLFPWKNVEQNIALGLESIGLPDGSKMQRIAKYLQMVGLDGASRHYPWELSGGMQQRVALARALAREPALLLLDEPFGALDTVIRSRLEDDLLELWRALGMTALLITHDIDEAIYLSDRILVLAGTPTAISADVAVPLSRPRDQVTTRSDPLFSSLRAQVYRALVAPGERA
jgi:NitT/TauT family transport system ATP-binding protein